MHFVMLDWIPFRGIKHYKGHFLVKWLSWNIGIRAMLDFPKFNIVPRNNILVLWKCTPKRSDMTHGACTRASQVCVSVTSVVCDSLQPLGLELSYRAKGMRQMCGCCSAFPSECGALPTAPGSRGNCHWKMTSSVAGQAPLSMEFSRQENWTG